MGEIFPRPPFSVGLSSGVNDHIALFVPPWSARFGSGSRGGAGFSKVIVAGLKKGIIEVRVRVLWFREAGEV